VNSHPPTPSHIGNTPASDEEGASFSWGIGAILAAALALGVAMVLGIWSATLVLAIAGLIMVAMSFFATAEDDQDKERKWQLLGGLTNSAVLVLTLFFPTILNRFWGLDKPLPVLDYDKQVAVPREKPRDPGKELGTDGFADAAGAWIRMENILVGVESVGIGEIPEAKPSGAASKSYLLIHFRIASIGGDDVTFEGFDNAERKVKLTDASNRTYSLVEQRVRVPAKGTAVFGPPGVKPFTLSSYDWFRRGVLLVFEPVPERIERMKLELPASAWGRRGTCRFVINDVFEEALAVPLN
jgi:hypothetical protein